MEYKIVRSCSHDKCEAINDEEEYVNDYIKKGWQPIGGVTIIKSKGDLLYTVAQAMIKE